MAGRALEIGRTNDDRPRRIDVMLRASGLAPSGAFRMGWAGTVSAWVGDNLVLRAGPGAAVEAAALTRLTSCDLAVVPHLIDAGACDGVDWLLETRLPGRRPRRVGSTLINQLGRFCSSLPRSPQPEAWRDDVTVLSGHFPLWMEPLAVIGRELETVASAVPGVLRHGDLWAGNLLVSGGRISGVVDWDAWQSHGFPASDLLHFITTTERQRRRVALGTIAVREPWNSSMFLSGTAPYWTAIGVTPDPEIRRGAGLAWWLGQVAGDVRRTPELADDPEWVAANIDAVLASRLLDWRG